MRALPGPRTGCPRAGWCVPGSLFQPASAGAAGGVRGFSNSVEVAAARSAALEGLLARAPLWSVLTLYNATGTWRVNNNQSPATVPYFITLLCCPFA